MRGSSVTPPFAKVCASDAAASGESVVFQKPADGARELERLLRDADLRRLVRDRERDRRAEAEGAARLRQILGGEVLLRELAEHHVEAPPHGDGERGAPLVSPRIVFELVRLDAALTAVITLLRFGVETGLLDQRRAGNDLEDAGGRRFGADVHVELLALVHVARVGEHAPRLDLDHHDPALRDPVPLHLRLRGALHDRVERELRGPAVREGCGHPLRADVET